MNSVKIKVLRKKPLVYIDRNWFPYRDIIDTDSFDTEFCQELEDAIEAFGVHKVIAYYDVEETDSQNRPILILAGYYVKGKPNGWCKYWFNTIYDSKPLFSRFAFGRGGIDL